jgi:hypothetical protein
MPPPSRRIVCLALACVLGIGGAPLGANAQGIDPAAQEYPVVHLPDSLRALKWAGGPTMDPEGDGQVPGRGDGRTVQVHLSPQVVYFRIFVYGTIDTIAPAVSIALDVDNDQSNGVAWYGANREFRVDRMLSVGPVSRAESRFTGYNGVTSAAGITARNWIDVKRGNLHFYLDTVDNSYVVGVPREDLGHTSGTPVKYIASVGGQARWNDDLMDEGWSLLILP